MTELHFDTAFHDLTGNLPLAWQRRLFDQFKAGEFKSVIDLPTGLGKTMVMAIWLIARANKFKVPTRLIYVVDRRTVVDQASDLARMLVARPMTKWMHDAFAGEPPAISTLRGQLADNREWSRDPSRPAIIVGTVDLIGSALLFSGYRNSFKARPLHAGLLGQDSLLVLDEAHLSKPFQKLVTSITRFQSEPSFRHTGAPPVKPLQIICMSATTSGDEGNRFKLEPPDLVDPIIAERFNAKKSLSVETTDNATDSIANAAGELAAANAGSRIVVFVRTPKQVDEVRKAIIKKDKLRETKIAMLTGTMRGLERDELVTPPSDDTQHDRSVMQRFLKPDNDPSRGECFLISTSAGEVGFDLNADHMVCDLTTLDSLIQRLGRVNRRGGEGRSAEIRLLAEVPKPKLKDGKPQTLSPFESALKATYDLLHSRSDGHKLDVSPTAIATLKQLLTADQLKAASTPEPTMVELTDILLDAWSMTSITAPIPGRPDVAPWIRGIADELPQTTIAWRAELDLPGFDQLDLETIEEWFDTHRVLTHETLSVPTREAAKHLLTRWQSFDADIEATLGGHLVIVDRAGLRPTRLEDFMASLERDDRQPSKSYDTIRNADLILPASFGGIERGKGLLDATAPEVPKDEGKRPTDEQKANAATRAVAPDVADARGRYRKVVTKPEDGKSECKPLAPGTKPASSARFTVILESDDDRTVRLISYIPKADRLESGQKQQSLEGHVVDVCKHIDAMLEALNLAKNNPIRIAAEFAADFHDHGKNREPFQQTVGGTASGAGRPWPPTVRGKSGGIDRGRPRRDYRHEFGSLREFIDAYHAKQLLDGAGEPISQDVFDLAMHLIASHHGRGRPHFPKGGFDPDVEDRSDAIHTDAIRRFARLQRKYGHWHLAWLENLLRCADAMASAEPETGVDDAKGDE